MHQMLIHMTFHLQKITSHISSVIYTVLNNQVHTFLNLWVISVSSSFALINYYSHYMPKCMWCHAMMQFTGLLCNIQYSLKFSRLSDFSFKKKFSWKNFHGFASPQNHARLRYLRHKHFKRRPCKTKIFEAQNPRNPRKFSPSKILGYTV